MMRRHRELLHRVALRMGRRGAVLLGFGIADLIYGISLVSSTGASPNATMIWFDSIGSLWLWAVLWWVTAAACFLCVFRRDDRFGFAAAIGIKVWWLLGCTLGWMLGEVGIGSVGVWFGLTFLVAVCAGWPEPEHWTAGVRSGEDQA